MARKDNPARCSMRDWMMAGDEQISATEKIIAVFSLVALVFIGATLMSLSHLIGMW